eukprot:6063955-Pleurochrysis_carterae.AAC.1
MPASPHMALISVAPPIRNDLPAKSAASRPIVAAISRANSRDSVDVQAIPSPVTNNGVVLGLPN